MEDVATPPRAAPEEEALPERIYYDLTAHDWYARGEPLVLGDDRYEAGSGLYAAAAADMRKVGEYDGVDVYVGADPDSTVYVPVYPGYWQPFHRSGAAPARQ